MGDIFLSHNFVPTNTFYDEKVECLFISFEVISESYNALLE